jgi:addiction module RelE/StbE family toxin
VQALYYTDQAQQDLLEAWLFIAQDNPSAADKLLDRIQDATLRLCDHPMLGRARPELSDRVRSLVTDTPYTLFYVADKQKITVIRVLHHARDVRAVAF